MLDREELPIPPHFRPEKVGEVWRVDYQAIAAAAHRWAAEHELQPAAKDQPKTCILAVDIQNTFCIPGFELFVAGRSGQAAVEDNRRLCSFIYRNLHRISRICPTMDTHYPMQIFHPIFLQDQTGRHPSPHTVITQEEVEEEKWRITPSVCEELGIDIEFGKRLLLEYTRELRKRHKYDWTIWPYHAVLGGIGHALVPAFEEAVFFHSIARHSQPAQQIKGTDPLTEHYSVLGPEVRTGPDGTILGNRNTQLLETFALFDMIIVAGQAKSHCVAWTIADLLSEEPFLLDSGLMNRIYLLDDCTSPVVIPGVVDYTEQADQAFEQFRALGMHIVSSTQPVASWPDSPY